PAPNASLDRIEPSAAKSPRRAAVRGPMAGWGFASSGQGPPRWAFPSDLPSSAIDDVTGSVKAPNGFSFIVGTGRTPDFRRAMYYLRIGRASKDSPRVTAGGG